MTKAVRLDQDALYDDAGLRVALGLRPAALSRARKAGELRSTTVGGRTLYTGQWVLEWLVAESVGRLPAAS